ncbi:hypothetical protein ACQEV2_40655 [Streptomyces sp. CA-251387]|uniref:hypothetical protein n=1 Tax=Streptomyces sp. CA-251387 TaxID=3240064 RepID=UPI003D904622
MTKLCQPVVSIQRADLSDPVSGHLSWGVLIAQNLVAAPGPLEWLYDEKIPLEVLLASARRNSPGFVERIKPEGADVMGLEDHAEGTTAVLRLAQPSAHRSATDEFRKEEFEMLLSASPDMWAALEGAGGVPTGIRELPKEQVLGPVREWEASLRRDLVRDRTRRTVGEVTWVWCPLSPKCGCPGQWW